LLFALSIPMVLGVTTNLLVPIIFKTSAAGKFGPFFSLVMIALVAHAIIRHRLMDIRLVIRRGAVYLAAFLVAGLCLTGLLVVSNALVHDEQQVPLREIFLALLVALFFPPLKAGVQRAFDRYLYREPYDYQRTLRQASQALAETIELPVLLDRIARVLRATLKPETVVVYLLDDEDNMFRRVYGPGPAPETVPAAAPLVIAAAGRPRPLFRDELGPRSRPGSEELEAAFAAWRAEVAVPLQDGTRLIGLLVVGPKRSGDPFFSDDEDLLTTLANQSAVAIRNAQAHARVLRVNQELQKILATIESGVVAIGPHRRVTLSNRAAEVLTGVPAGTLRGRPVCELPVPLAGLVADTAQDGEPRLQVEFRLPDSAGQVVPLVCSTSPLRDPDGSLVGAVAVFNDLSRLKELEQEKRRSERLGSLEAIASGMVHEIRNPLVAIKTFIQLLPRRAHEAEFRETMVRVAEREIARVEDLLGRLRTLASASRQPMVPLDVRDPLGAALELLGPEREARTIRLRMVADGAPRQILGNASQLEQLFHNLCLNALEAMGTEGELTVRVADLRQSGGTTLLVEISDTGRGIPDDLLPRIFDPFVTTKASGSGLGLAICRSIADAHRASLTVRNNIGRTGATFTLEFPVPVSQTVAVPA
jgi:PAS domain S-box-containing protein